MKKIYKRGLCWLRRDLRLADHTALYHAHRECEEVVVCFVFDHELLNRLKREYEGFNLPLSDKRLGFIQQSLIEVNRELESVGSKLMVRYGVQWEQVELLASELSIDKLYFNRDYEPRARDRDLRVIESLTNKNIQVEHFRDHVLFEHHQVRTQTGQIYKVFTPYKKRWLELFNENNQELLKDFTPIKPQYVTIETLNNHASLNLLDQQGLEKVLGFTCPAPTLPAGRTQALERLAHFQKTALSTYHANRDFPARAGTSSLSVSIRHGVISAREMTRAALSSRTKGAEIWLSELIWREFYQMILDTHPQVVKHSFKPDYDRIKWIGGQKEFRAWRDGQTGFPIVDAAMRCLNQTGQMHNRLRMIVGSFLCKTLLVDWRLGERYFALKLLDFDLAANNGGWQWCSSSGCDAQPYFRIFNPHAQSEKFDSDGEFIKSWCPELKELPAKHIHGPQSKYPLPASYPTPIVDYAAKRKEALAMYGELKP
jgi:deoxyribodipyrimidine photo-lyase